MARRAKLVLDKGAYCGEGGFLGQMAAMHACGPYQIDHISVEAHLNYTNNQPSGSVRAPTAPQVCWGLEQHMDEVAAAIGPRSRRTPSPDADRGGRRGPDATGVRQGRCTGHPREGRRDDRVRPRSARRRGDRRRGRVVAVHGGALGRVRADERRRQRDDRDRRAGERQRRCHGDADVRRRRSSASIRTTSRSCIRTPTSRRGTWVRAARRRRSTTAERSSPPRRRSASSSSTPRPTSSRRPRRPRAHRRRRAREGIARPVGRDRRSRRARSAPCTGRVRARSPRHRPATRADASDGSGNETFLAPQLITQAAHVKVDRATGVVRVLRVAAAHDSGRILNRAGADGQVLGGVVMGVGPRALRGHDARRAGPAAEPAPARLQAAHVLRRARDRGGVGRVRLGRAARDEGRRRAAAGADRRRDRERDLEGDRPATCRGCR